MAPIDDLRLSQRRCLLYWAVIERYFARKEGELAVQQSITKGKISVANVKRIFSITHVRRSAGKGNEKKFRKVINRAVGRKWPGDIMARAQSCAKMTTQVHNWGNFRGLPASAVTKIVWFLKPNGWTFFDGYAASALGVGGIPATVRMVNYYGELNRRKFNAQACDIGRILKKYRLSRLYGERVIDAFLWLAGNSTVGTINQINKRRKSLKGLKQPTRTRLVRAASAVAMAHANGLLK